MSAPKGNKYAGSRKGVPNKRTEQWEAFATYCMEGGLNRFQSELEKLKGKDFVNTFLNLLEYHKPKLARTEMDLTTTVELKQTFEIAGKKIEF